LLGHEEGVKVPESSVDESRQSLSVAEIELQRQRSKLTCQ
jgi:hypothetical protein